MSLREEVSDYLRREAKPRRRLSWNESPKRVRRQKRSPQETDISRLCANDAMIARRCAAWDKRFTERPGLTPEGYIAIYGGTRETVIKYARMCGLTLPSKRDEPHQPNQITLAAAIDHLDHAMTYTAAARKHRLSKGQVAGAVHRERARRKAAQQ